MAGARNSGDWPEAGPGWELGAINLIVRFFPSPVSWFTRPLLPRLTNFKQLFKLNLSEISLQKSSLTSPGPAPPVRFGVRRGEVQKKNKTGTLQEQITSNEARRGSSQISELLH